MLFKQSNSKNLSQTKLSILLPQQSAFPAGEVNMVETRPQHSSGNISFYGSKFLAHLNKQSIARTHGSGPIAGQSPPPTLHTVKTMEYSWYFPLNFFLCGRDLLSWTARTEESVCLDALFDKTTTVNAFLSTKFRTQTLFGK